MIPTVRIQNVSHEQELTDQANADRLNDRYGADLLWCEPWKKWLVWDGKRWATDRQLLVEGMARQVSEQLWKQVNKAIRSSRIEISRKLISHAKETSSRRGIRNMLELARSRVPALPEDLDRDPMLLNVANGTLNLNTLVLQPHSRHDRLTKLASVEYDEQRECSLWLKFLNEVFDGDQDVIAYVQKLSGYWLTGQINEHVLPFFVGTGANGKTVFINTIMAMLGPDYAIKAPSDLLLQKQSAHPTELADLHGKRLVVCSETDRGRHLAESLVKELTGGEKIRARRMREDFWEFFPSHKLVMVTNYLPKVGGTDNGIWRRIHVLPFSINFPLDRQDKELGAKLRNELPGILNWALRGLGELQRGGLAIPNAVGIASEAYRRQNDSIRQFIDACCVSSADAVSEATELYKAYIGWCRDHGESPLSSNDLRHVLGKDFRRSRVTKGPHKGRYAWLGIRLLSEDGEGR